MRQMIRLLALCLFAAASAARGSEMPPAMADLAARVLPAVVSIAAMAPAGSDAQDQDNGDGSGDGGSGDDSALRTADNASGSVVPPPKTVESLGSGFVFDPTGYILTNNHVVNNATDITVTFPDGSVYPAIIAGQDKDGDLAVLKLQAGHPLPFVKFGDSSKLRVGDWVLAVGNPFGLPGSSSAGIVSALHRQIQDTSYDDFIQTDAAINRGNSGGPLFNLQGEVVGVNSAIESPGGTSDGIGFAIPAAMAEPVALALAHGGVMNRGWLGVATEDVTPQMQQMLGLRDTAGALVGAVSTGSPADGVLQPGDVVVALAGVKLADPRALFIRTAEIPAGQSVVVRFYRDGGVGQADITPAEPPPPLNETIPAPPPPPPKPVSLPPLGLSLAGKPAADGGVQVLSATGPARQAGIVAGDEITELNGQPVTSAADIHTRTQALGKLPPIFLVSGNDETGNDPGLRWIAVP